MDPHIEPRLRHWIVAIFLVWLLVAGALTVYRFDDIAQLNFPDTDDAQRLVQVRDWLGGQAWGDVDQYRMNPPGGASMHWSRLVDLPLAGVIVITEPLLGRAMAERLAVTIIPLLTLLAALLTAGLAASRIERNAWTPFLGALLLLSAGPLLPLFAPLRIDHHGWQMVLLLGLMAMLMKPHGTLASAMLAALCAVGAVSIGLETLPHILAASAVLVAAWIVRPAAFALRLRGYGLGIAIATVAAYPVLVPSVRWTMAACDAMSPVYLAVFTAAGLFSFGLTYMPQRHHLMLRLGVAATGFVAIAGSVMQMYPQCAAGPLADLDPRFLPVLNGISEARPIFSYLADTPLNIVYYGLYPIIGVGAAIYACRKAEPDRLFGWLLLTIVLIVASGLMLLQIRAAYAANALAAIACSAVAMRFLPRVRAISAMLPRLLATTALLVFFSGAFPVFVALTIKSAGLVPDKKLPEAANAAAKAGRCTDRAVLAPLAALPRGTIANVVDLGPALLVHTPHTVMAGPYHRNAKAIVDSMRIWRAGDPEARAIAARYGATYLLGCMAMPDLNNAKTQAPTGLWSRLLSGRTPDWLEPLPLPRGSPLRLYRIKG